LPNPLDFYRATEPRRYAEPYPDSYTSPGPATSSLRLCKSAQQQVDDSSIACPPPGSCLEKGLRPLILSLTLSVGPEPVSLIPSVSWPLTWPLAETGALSRPEGRKSQTQAPLPTHSTDATRLDNPTAGGSFFPVPAVTAPALDRPSLSRPRSRPIPLRRPAICTSACCHLRLSTLGGENTAPPFSTSASAHRRLPCGGGYDTSFSAAVLSGTAGRQHLLRPGGTALLCLRFAALRVFRSLPKKLAIICPGRTANLFRFPQKKRSLAWGAGTTCFIAPREKAGRKRRKTLCIKTAFPSSASSATTHN
jgi:hypothetical protein